MSVIPRRQVAYCEQRSIRMSKRHFNDKSRAFPGKWVEKTTFTGAKGSDTEYGT